MNSDPYEDAIADTAKRVRINYDSKHVRRIEELITTAIDEILDTVAINQPLFKVSELLKVGGFYEGTKIVEPDEFDYLAVIEELSKPGAVTLELDPARAGIARLKLNESLNADGKWDNLCSDGYIRCIQLDQEIGSEKSRKYKNFGRAVIKAVLTRNSGKLKLIFDESIFLEYNPREYECDMYELKKALILRVVAEIPNIRLQFIIESKRINVDLSPAVRYHNDCFSPELCVSPILAESVKQHGSVLCVGQIDCDVRISYTETEVEYIKVTMQERHRLIYIYLKYVAKVVKEYYTGTFPSYVLKNVCIRHDLQCLKPTRKSSECLRDVLDVLHEEIATRRLSTAFNASVNIMANHKRRALVHKDVATKSSNSAFIGSTENQTVSGLDMMMYKVYISVIPYLKMIVPRLSDYSNISHNHESELRSLVKEAKSEFDEREFECVLEMLYSRRQ